MNIRTRAVWPLVVMAAIVVFALSVMGGAALNVSAAPQAAVTPVAVVSLPSGGEESAIIKFYTAKAITADEQNCLDLREYRTLDLEFVVDQTTTNTTTVILEHTIGAGADLTTNTVGQTVVSANAADADDLNRFDLYGVYTCVDINVTNSNPITWTVWGIARK